MICRHDCETPPPFPRRIFNRPGLDRIEHRIGSYAEMRAHILARINADPRLSAWTHRFADDPGIALVEGAAMVGDVLTFYQTLYANELFLRTARWRASVADLVRLLGYRLAPGLAGESTFALMVTGDRPVLVPRGFAFKTQIEGQGTPVVFETTTAATAYPHLSSFHLYRPRVTPSIYHGTRSFEVVSELPAGLTLKPGDRLMLGVPSPTGGGPRELQHFQIAVVDRTWESFGSTFVAIKGGLQSLRAPAFSRQLFLAGALVVQTQSAQLTLAKAIIPAAGIRLDPALALAPPVAPPPASVPELYAFKLGPSHRHFGHNAPAQQVTIDENGRATTSAVSFVRRHDASTGSPASPAIAATLLPLDAAVDGISAGTTLVIEGRVGVSAASPSSLPVCLVRAITHVEKGNAGWGPETGPSTLLTLDRALAVSGSGLDYTFADVRTLNVHEVVGQGFRLRAEPQPVSAPTGKALDFYGTGDNVHALGDRALLLSGPAGELVSANVVAVAPPAEEASLAAFRRITLDRDVRYAEFGHDAPQVTVYGNVISATQGKTEDVTVLGDGDHRQVFQTFPLPKAPLTYLLAPEETPAHHAELGVWVGGVQWKRVDSFFNAKPDGQVFVVREDADGKSYVQFGDGKTGARLPSGTGNVAVSYRTGIGATGALQAGTTPQAASRLTGLDKVLMPGKAVGGAAPESEASARVAAPGRMQSLGRLVSLADYEAEALAVPGVVKARATWAETGGVPVLRLTVLTASEAPADAEKVAQTLRALDRARGARRYALDVIQGSRRWVHVALTVGHDARRIAADVRVAILEALGVTGEEANGIRGDHGLFSVSERQFGQSAHSSQIIAAVQQVAGVVWVKLTGAQPTIEPSPLALVTLPLLPKVYRAIPCEDARILALDSRHLTLALVAVADLTDVPS